MSDFQKDQYRPNLPKSEEYLRGVSESISKKEPLEEISFEYLTDILESLNIQHDPYKMINLEDQNPDGLIDIVEESFNKIQETVLNQELKEKLYRLWDYLGESDPLEKSDLIFVVGGPHPQKVDEAVRLKQGGYADKILFTGRKASYMGDVDISEAEYLAGLAEKKGIDFADMILEKEAKNTPENATLSIQKFKELGIWPESIILIALPYHMRRCYLTVKSAGISADWNPHIIRRTVPSSKYDRENYFSNINGWSYVFFEYIKLYGARLMGHF